MSRLPDPEDMPLGDTPNVPPVRIRRNFTTNSGKDMIIDTLDLPKSQVKSVTGQVPPQIAQIPPTPDIVQRDKTVSGYSIKLVKNHLLPSKGLCLM